MTDKPIANIAASVRQRLMNLRNAQGGDYNALLTQLVILRSSDLDDEILAQAIAATFKRRQTLLPEQVPFGLSSEYGRDAVSQRRWSEFLRRIQIEDTPAHLVHVVDAIRQRVWPLMKKSGV